MPMIPEAAYAMLACARIGAIHSVVFGGFSPDSARRPHRGLRQPKVVITADEGLRGGKQGAAQGQCRRRARQGGGVDHVSSSSSAPARRR
jgi:acyl-coenzyme A synthetase/AMP-(fatty) acid ligase